MIQETFRVCYDRLWALLRTRKMKKKDLMRITHLSSAVIAMNTLLKICEVLHCTLDEIVDISSVFGRTPDRSVTQ